MQTTYFQHEIQSPSLHHFVPKLGTLFLGKLTYFSKEITAQYLGSAEYYFAVQISALENLVYVATVAMHLFGKPGYCSTLPVKFLLDNIADVNFLHKKA